MRWSQRKHSSSLWINFILKNENIDSRKYSEASLVSAQMSPDVVIAAVIAAASAPVDAKRHDGSGCTLRPLMRGGKEYWLVRLRGRRRCRGRRAKGWRNRQAPSRGPTATVSLRRASSQRLAAVPTRRKDGHDGWHGRPRAQSRPRVLPPAREEQAAVQRAARPAAIRTQAVAGLLRADLWRLHEALEVPATAQVRDKDRERKRKCPRICVRVRMYKIGRENER